MHNVTPAKWQEWEQESPTLLLKEVIRQRIAEAKDDLSRQSNDREYDLVVKGLIQGLTEAIEFTPEFIKEKEQDEF